MELGNRADTFEQRTEELKSRFLEQLKVLGGESGLTREQTKEIFDLYIADKSWDDIEQYNADGSPKEKE